MTAGGRAVVSDAGRRLDARRLPAALGRRAAPSLSPTSAKTIGQAVAVEIAIEILPRGGEYALEEACWRERAQAAVRAEALDNRLVALERPRDGTYADLHGGTGEHDAAADSACSLDEAGIRQVLHHLLQMIARYGEIRREFFGREPPVGLHR